MYMHQKQKQNMQQNIPYLTLKMEVFSLKKSCKFRLLMEHKTWFSMQCYEEVRNGARKKTFYDPMFVSLIPVCYIMNMYVLEVICYNFTILVYFRLL